MKKKTERRKHSGESKRLTRLSGMPAARRETSKELVQPHEWDALLHSFEGEGAAAQTVQDSASDLAIDSSDDLWEKLSSTRWLKDGRDEDIGTRSTVAQRPAK